MAIQEIAIRLSESVPLATQIYKQYTPPAGSIVYLMDLQAEAAFTVNSEIRIIWDFGGQDEEILWSMRGSSKFEPKLTIDSSKTDGNKKIALVADNGETLALNMSAYVTILVEE